MDEGDTMIGDMRGQDAQKSGALRKLGGVALAGALLGGAFYGGMRMERSQTASQLEQIAQAPLAPGTFDVTSSASTGAYRFDVRLNAQGQREAYFINNANSKELLLPSYSGDIIAASRGNGEYVMKAGKGTMEFFRYVGTKLGVETEGWRDASPGTNPIAK